MVFLVTLKSFFFSRWKVFSWIDPWFRKRHTQRSGVTESVIVVKRVIYVREGTE